MGMSTRFTATVIVDDKFDDIFNDILKLPKQDLQQNCIKMASAKKKKFMYACFGNTPSGDAEVMLDSYNGRKAIYVDINGDEEFLMSMMAMINDVLSKYGFSLIDDEYELV